MGENHLDKILEVKFLLIPKELPLGHPILAYYNSNYTLSKDELLRVSLRPDRLVMDDNSVFMKGTETAYLDRDKKNILKVSYCRSNALFKER